MHPVNRSGVGSCGQVIASVRIGSGKFFISRVMASTHESALIEACNPSTTPKRLRELWMRRLKKRNQLGAVIAANPNADENLLLELAADYPKEVIGNPRFQLLELSGEAWWENCSLDSLCSLALATGEDGASSLKAGLRLLFQQLYDEYSEMVSVRKREAWLYQRSIEIDANSLDSNRPPFDILLDVDLCALMEGEDAPWLEIGVSADSFGRDWVCSLIKSLRNECIVSLFGVFGQDPYENIVMQDAISETAVLSTINENVRIDELSLLNKETDQLILTARVYYECSFDEEPMTLFEDGVLSIPVSRHVGGDAEGEGVSRGSSDDLGDLEPLWGWEPAFLAPEIRTLNWEEWLSAWIMS